MLTLNSPAKINLFLRVLRKREDGYHELASLFQTIDLCDKIHIELSTKDQFFCSDPSLPTDQTNLVIKALHLFRRKTGIEQPCNISLEKNIPQQAGLGGGSSNAATILWALNKLSGQPATDQQLSEWSSEIGSDIPFFLSTGTAYCTGRGENVRNLESLPHTELWIAKPPFGLSTPHVYRHLNPAALPQRHPEQILDSFFNLSPIYFNDLEEAAFALSPEMLALKQLFLAEGFPHVLMCGSGSCFFLIGNQNPPRLPKITFYRTRFINRSVFSWF